MWWEDISLTIEFLLKKWLDIDCETSTFRDTNKLELISWKKTAGFMNQICVKFV